MSRQLLGAHVRHFAFDDADIGAVRSIFGRDLGHAKVEHLGDAIPADHDVGRRHVPMHQPQRAPVAIPRAMRKVQALGDAGDDTHRNRPRNPGLPLRLGMPQQRRQREAMDVLHRHVLVAVDLAVVVDVRDARVVDAGCDRRLGLEHADKLLILRQVRQDALDHQLLLKAGRAALFCQEHFCHAAGRQVRKQHVFAKCAR